MNLRGRLCCSAMALGILTGLGTMATAQEVPGWLEKSGDGWDDRRARLQEFGEGFADSMTMYETLRDAAGGGDTLDWQQMSEPAFDWSGIFTRSGGGLSFDPEIPASDGATTAQLTEAGTAVVEEKKRQISETGGEYDPISDCRPPGVPRWATEPFLHEFIVTPEQTWLINEMVNDVRRVYTDGRDHTPEEDAYPTWNGDTIGFWSDDMLVTHTTYLMPGQYQRGIQPDYSDETTLVERWKKTGDKTLEADFWVFDPVNLSAPWYTRQSWTKLTNDDHYLRIRYWDCGENSNNQIVVRDDGTSQFPDFDWLDNDAELSDDPAVAAAQKDMLNQANEGDTK